jgi:hypothetical protein
VLTCVLSGLIHSIGMRSARPLKVRSHRRATPVLSRRLEPIGAAPILQVGFLTSLVVIGCWYGALSWARQARNRSNALMAIIHCGQARPASHVRAALVPFHRLAG